MEKMETIQVLGLEKAHLARGLVRTPRTMRRKYPIASGGVGMSPALPSESCSDSEEIHSSDVRLLM